MQRKLYGTFLILNQKMKDRMKNSLFLLFLMTLVLFTACEKESITGDLTDADALIKAIAAADKTEVELAEVPAALDRQLDIDYADENTLEIYRANALGYEVRTRCHGASQLAELGKLYFNVEGKPLRKNGESEDWADRHRPDCFELVYPVSVTLPDGSTLTANDRETLWMGIRDFYQNNPDAEGKPNLVYPIQIVFEDADAPVTIENRMQLRRAKRSCRERPRPCFRLVYPLTVVLPDGSTATGDTKMALRIAIRDWYQANPDVTEKPDLVFPVTIEFRDGTNQEIASADELQAAKEDCRP